MAGPVVLFSHGLGGTREGSAYLGRHWASRGYVAVFLQHPGSDDSVWKGVPAAKRMSAMQEAASAKNLQLRIQDVPAVLDQLSKWNKDSKHPLSGRLDAQRVGMSGHSFGAVTTQAVSGQAAGIGQRQADPRIKAADIMSPSVPRIGSAERAFAGVKLPWLLMTGTRDGSPIGNQTPESRRGVFPALPPGDKYELVLDKAEHSAFTERPLPGEKEKLNPNHHRAILALSTAFLDAYLRDDVAAKKWLAGAGPRGVLEAGDVWQRK
jgi:predicted dienelactone hydrolase